MNTVFMITLAIAFALLVYCIVEFVRSYLTIKRCETDLKILRRRRRNIIMSMIPDPEEIARK